MARYDVACLACGRVAQTGLWADDVALTRPGRGRCGHCGGCLAAEHVGDFSRTSPAVLAAELEDGVQRCATCRARLSACNRSGRCRRCYLVWRYHNNPTVRAKQLALQRRWRVQRSIQARAEAEA